MVDKGFPGVRHVREGWDALATRAERAEWRAAAACGGATRSGARGELGVQSKLTHVVGTVPVSTAPSQHRSSLYSTVLHTAGIIIDDFHTIFHTVEGFSHLEQGFKGVP